MSKAKARSRRTTKTATTSRPRFNKLAFFGDLGYEPHTGQLEVHQSDAPRRILACGVRWGKTKCAAMEGLPAVCLPQQCNIGAYSAVIDSSGMAHTP